MVYREEKRHYLGESSFPQDARRIFYKARDKTERLTCATVCSQVESRPRAKVSLCLAGARSASIPFR
ncbi:hypothetical protein CAJAP_03608 [Camponotus japonicus]